MKNIHLFIQINFIPFKVIPSRYNALMSTFFPIAETLVKFDFTDSHDAWLKIDTYRVPTDRRIDYQRHDAQDDQLQPRDWKIHSGAY